jgi:hypothetical protein
MEAIPSINRATATDEEKLAWVKARAAVEPWEIVVGSVIQDMTLMGIPLKQDLVLLMMQDAMTGGEQGVRDFIAGLTLAAVAREEAPAHDCAVTAEVGGTGYQCREHRDDAGHAYHVFAAHWPACPAPWCRLEPGHRDLHDIPFGTPEIITPFQKEASSGL